MLESFGPRQFEYNPRHESLLAVGTVTGEVLVVDHDRGVPIGSFSRAGRSPRDAILGVSWLSSRPDVFVTGSAKGLTRVHRVRTGPSLCGDLDAMSDAAAPSKERWLESLTWQSARGLPSGEVVDEASWRATMGCAPAPNECHITSTTLSQYADLTSVHVNSTDEKLLCSGYSNDVSVYDIETGKRAVHFRSAHTAHINIARFAHESPNVMATSSFDKTIKVWDLRTPKRPNYTIKSERGFVMIAFSPNDLTLLGSAVDNEVTLFSSMDGRRLLGLDAARTGNRDNYTRSYFMDGGDVIVCGSSEQRTLRYFCAHTGEFLDSTELFPGRSHSSLFVQSLRGSPHRQGESVVLVNHRDSAHGLCMIKTRRMTG
ncbi:hypothetical protein FNF27_06806 [Cafeteria roenbergensis]|uniref:Uncharacterized protein n=1 Tax=Cafeteria roenbergensis TaxID=33653 RepID=A0A5A8DYZ8_CAFRO|nr:hypothetical protein FNF27_06806 [Cafeteria roenbergensis]